MLYYDALISWNTPATEINDVVKCSAFFNLEKIQAIRYKQQFFCDYNSYITIWRWSYYSHKTSTTDEMLDSFSITEFPTLLFRLSPQQKHWVVNVQYSETRFHSFSLIRAIHLIYNSVFTKCASKQREYDYVSTY